MSQPASTPPPRAAAAPSPVKPAHKAPPPRVNSPFSPNGFSPSPRTTPTPSGPVVGRTPPPARSTAPGRSPAPGRSQPYDPGNGRGGGGTGRGHPAAADAGSLTPAGHRAYCARNIQHAVQGAAAVAQHSANMRRGIKKNKTMSWTLKAMATRRNKRADRKVIAAYQALAKAWLNKSKVRDQVDAEVNASSKQRRPSAAEYITE